MLMCLFEEQLLWTGAFVVEDKLSRFAFCKYGVSLYGLYTL